MKKRLRLLTSLLALGFTQSVFALGLGEINAESALNEPLEARIELLNVGSLSEQELIVAIGTPDDYRIAGVERDFFHTSIQFEPHIEGTGGRPYVSLTTTAPVREPYLNFVVQVRWPQGKLLREYTLLLDLPVFSGREQEQAVSQPEAAPTPVEEVSRPPARTVRTPATRISAGASITGDEYRVQNGDTLWSLSGRIAQGGEMSRHQVMLAIRDLNPEAFVNGDPDSLQAGRLIRVPTAEQANRRSLSQAVAEFTAIQEGRGSVAATPVSAAPANFREQSSGSDTDSGRLALSSNSALGSGAGNAEDVEGLVDENQTLKEELDRAEIENEDLRARLSALEEQLSVSRALVEVESGDMARVQSGLTAANDAEQTAAETDPEAADAEAAPAETEAAESEPAETEPVPVDTPQPPAQPEAGLFAKLMSFLPFLGALVVVALLVVMLILKRRRDSGEDQLFHDEDGDDEASPLDEPPAKAAAPAFDETRVMDETASFETSDSEEDDDHGFESMDELFGGQHDDTEEPEPAKEPEQDSDAAAPSMDDVAAEDVEDIDLEAALEDLDEFGDLDSFGEDEVEDLDLGEDDAGADELDEPESRVQADAAGDTEESNDLDFESLELPGVEEDADEDDSADDDEDDDNGMDFDLGDFELPSEDDDLDGDEDDKSAPSGNEMDFDSGDLELPGDDESDGDSSDEDEFDAGNSMEFDGEIELPEAEDDAVDQQEPAGNEMEFDSSDLELPDAEEDTDESDADDNAMDFDIGEIELPEVDETEDEPVDEDSDLDLPQDDEPEAPAVEQDEDHSEDMDALLSGLDDEVEDLPDLEDDADAEEDVDLDLDGDLDLDEDGLLAGLGEDDGEDSSDLSEEMATKLELADAYVEMGDVRGAKELIDEIMADGNDEQKAEAAKLAERIEGLI